MPGMASSCIHRCPACGFRLEAWDDGSPYILDDKGRPRFFHHPCEVEGRNEILASCEWAQGREGADLARLVEARSGVMEDFICLQCARRFKCDSGRKTPKCPRCGSEDVHDQYLLGGVTCPKCRRGRFPDTPEQGAIS